MTAEQVRLEEAANKNVPWKKWGPYLSERQWGTVREDYSEGGNAWDYFSHDQARSRAYRWGEDGDSFLSRYCGNETACAIPPSILLFAREPEALTTTYSRQASRRTGRVRLTPARLGDGLPPWLMAMGRPVWSGTIMCGSRPSSSYTVATRSPGRHRIDPGRRLAIAAAMDKALLDAAAGEQAEAALGPVVAAGPAVDARRAAHVAVDHHQRARPQAALHKVVEEHVDTMRSRYGSSQLRSMLKLLLCVSQWPVPLVSVWIVTKVTPASTSRRASRSSSRTGRGHSVRGPPAAPCPGRMPSATTATATDRMPAVAFASSLACRSMPAGRAASLTCSSKRPPAIEGVERHRGAATASVGSPMATSVGS